MADNPLKLGRANQIGIVVRDLRQSMRYYWEVLGIGPWRGYRIGPHMLKDVVYKGHPAIYSTEIALASAGPVELELIQYLEGESIHRDFLERCGEGVNHFGIFVDDLEEATLAMERMGYPVLQRGMGFGKSGDGGYVYFDTLAACGTVTEFIKIATEPKEPDFVFP